MRDPGGRLTVTAAQYRLAAPARDTTGGPADVQVAGGALVVAPAGGEVLRVPFGQITALTQNGAYTVQLALPDGSVLELSRMGAMTTQLLAELHDGRAGAIAAALRPVGPAVIFTGQRGARTVELRVHDDALLVIGDGTASGGADGSGGAGGDDGASERVAFSFVSAVHTEEYVVTIELGERPPLFVTRLGRRTGEFADLLAARLTAARTRTAAFLGALVPALDPVALSETAALLRDGVAVPAAVLDGIQPGLAQALAGRAVAPDRRAALAGLGERGPVTLGFRQVMTAYRAATGLTPWRPTAPAASGTDHGNPALMGAGLGGMMAAGFLGDAGGGSGGSGLGGMMPGGLAAGLMAGGMLPGAVLPGAVLPGAMLAGEVLAGEVAAAGMPFGAGGYGSAGGYGGGSGLGGDRWAMRALQGLGGGAGSERPMAPRPDVSRGSLIPAGEDLAALTVTGDSPAVLAFVLVPVGGRVVLEFLNEPGAPTFVYQAAGADGLAAVNRALDDCGFQPAAAARLGPPLAGQVPHDEHWAAGLDALLAG
jgi:hypothetical protein